jgi:YVTN family beta-propeller protein
LIWRRFGMLTAGLTLFGLFTFLCLSLNNPQPQLDGSMRLQHAVAEDDLYKSPIQLAMTRDGKTLYAVCENSNEVLIINLSNSKVIGTLKTGRHPFGLTLNPDETRLYVSNRWDDSVMVFDIAERRLVQTIPDLEEPHQLKTDFSGTYLFVVNMGSNTLSLVETKTGHQLKRLGTGAFPFGEAFDPTGRYLFVSHQLSNPVPFRTAPVTELTIVDSGTKFVAGRLRFESSVAGQDVAVSPDGQLVVVALEFPKNLIPETQIYQGWMVTHGFAVAEAHPNGRVAYFLLDETNRYFTDPYGLAFSPDGKYLFVSSSGVDQISVVDMKKLMGVLQFQDGKIGLSDETIRLYARHLGLSAEYVVGRIPTGSNPKDLVISPDGQRLYIANRLADSISVIDARTFQPAGTIDLGGPRIETPLRHGEKLFNSSQFSYQKQLSCNTCHPEYHVDGLQYDIVSSADGMGQNLVDNRSLRGIAFTSPFKWNGKNPTITRQDGPRTAQLFFRSHGFDPQQLKDIVKFVESIPLSPNRFQAYNNRADEVVLTEAQEEGKQIFERAFVRAGPFAGRYIPAGNRCITCHRPPYYTDHKLHNVGNRAYVDTDSLVDTPHLGNVADSAPYLHDGRCYSLEEIWTVYNADDMHGTTNGTIDKRELNALVEYLKTLTSRPAYTDQEFLRVMFPPSTERRSLFRVQDLATPAKSSARYEGVKVCANCHLNQYKTLLGTGHGRSWVVLGREVAKQVAKELGVKGNPQYSATCLACHGTAAGVTTDSRALNFRIEEGVSCEGCHGPGGQYTRVMNDRAQAIAAGLKIPVPADCMVCHQLKPSHSMLKTNLQPFDLEAGMRRINHWTERGKAAPVKDDGGGM